MSANIVPGYPRLSLQDLWLCRDKDAAGSSSFTAFEWHNVTHISVYVVLSRRSYECIFSEWCLSFAGYSGVPCRVILIHFPSAC